METSREYMDLLAVGATHEEAIETLRIINSDLEFQNGYFRTNPRSQDHQDQARTC